MISQGSPLTVTAPPDGGQSTLDKLPTAFASLFPPAGRRRRWIAIYKCPRCSGHHTTFSWSGKVAGRRASGCGRAIWVVVARRYGGDR
ncbi:hypothetical protein GCM10027590_17210 [Nocardiopsis nanhaiensis]